MAHGHSSRNESDWGKIAITVRRAKTGMKQRMQNSHEKGVANHSASSLALLPRGTQGSVDRE